MRHVSILLGILGLAAAAQAQRPIDNALPSGGGQGGFEPAASLLAVTRWSDDFNRVNGPPLGPDWTDQQGTFAIFMNRGYSSSSGSAWTQHNTASGGYATSIAQVEFLPSATGATVRYVALIFGAGSGTDRLFIKVQDNTGDGLYDRVFFYKNGSGPWGASTYFFDLATPIVAGVMTGYFTSLGDVANLDIDRDGDGLADEHFEVGGILTAGLTLGTGFGIGAYGNAQFDNWWAQGARFTETSGTPPCLSQLLDFDVPFVPSGAIDSDSPVFTEVGIASVTPLGTWTQGSDTITAGSNDSGQSLVVQAPVGAPPTLLVAGVGQPLASPTAGAGLEIVLEQPATAFSVLFVDQAGFTYTVELLLGTSSLGTHTTTYGSSFPVPPRTWTVAAEYFNRIRITFPVATNGVGIDDLAIQAPFFVAGGIGGTFPTSTSGVNGVYPWSGQTAVPSLPPNAFATTVDVPASATHFSRVALYGLVHTWAGDAHFVLRSPTGQRYNLACPPNKYNPSSYSDGNSCDYNGDYTFVDAVDSAMNFPADAATACNGGAFLTPGFYHQYFGAGPGAWPSSAPNNLGVLNVPLRSIPVEPGRWTLECYDWVLGADSGSFSRWELRGGAELPCAPIAYCSAGSTTHGCAATITASANPSASLATPCTLTVANVEGQQSGIVFYGLSAFSGPWCSTGGTSFLCVKSPFERTGVQGTGGAAGGCNGSLSLNWNAWSGANPLALGFPYTVGEHLYFQGWFRDPPACKTTALSNAVELTLQP